tara:strand:+ start:759 stop:974 length:216 start_codon:yes stop_codon:yes gene_type:complete
MHCILIILLFLLITLSIVSDGNKEPFIESLNVYKNCKKIVREKRNIFEKFSKNKIDDVKYEVRRVIRQSGL